MYEIHCLLLRDLHILDQTIPQSYTFLCIFVYFRPGEAFADFFGADLVIGRPSLSGVPEPGLKGHRYRVQP